jgi:hypothetical protein
MKCNGRTCSNEALPGLKACARCREWRNKHHRETRKSKDKNLCHRGDCTNPVEPGFKSCSSCREKERLRDDANREEVRAKGQKIYQEVKREVFSHYGSKCACCGEARLEFLSIDHIDGNGAEHRRMIGSGGRNFYYWLRDNGYPEGYRAMCHNCNFALDHYGYCPHNNGLTQTIHVGRPRKERSPSNKPSGTVLVPTGT